MSLRDTLKNFQDFAENNGKVTVDKNGNKTTELSTHDLFGFMAQSAVSKLKTMSKQEIKDLKKVKPILTVKPPR